MNWSLCKSYEHTQYARQSVCLSVSLSQDWTLTIKSSPLKSEVTWSFIRGYCRCCSPAWWWWSAPSLVLQGSAALFSVHLDVEGLTCSRNDNWRKAEGRLLIGWLEDSSRVLTKCITSKPFKCMHCTKAFKSSSNLLIHLRTQTQEKPRAKNKS